MKVGHRAPPADDEVPVPPPLAGLPAGDRHCDLVLTGGVASGVVYPWAIVELARHYQFRRIAGTSVGAMAAALAAAAEYGRRNGHPRAFEPLRRAPEALAETLPDGRTRMLSLFQPRAAGRRLLALFVAWLRQSNGGSDPGAVGVRRLLGLVAGAFAVELGLGALVGLGLAAGLLVGLVCVDVLLAWPVPRPGGATGWLLLAAFGGVAALAGAAVMLWRAVTGDLRHGIVGHGYGLCAGAAADADLERGRTPATPHERDQPGLTDWLHEGIQRSAGRRLDGRPLTFRDLWQAPIGPGSATAGGDAPADRAIDLVVLTTSLGQMRPVRLPNLDATNRLFFDPAELAGHFPPVVLAALVASARRWTVDSGGALRELPPDPRAAACPHDRHWLYELPGADLPIVVAARLSLSFPVLFSAVPLYAVDFDARRRERRFRRVWFSDGGLCSNFPIHLFDSALPAHPTFGLWLDKRPPTYPKLWFWLPRRFIEGAASGLSDFDHEGGGDARSPWVQLGRFLFASVETAKDWGDRMTMRQPHTRHRVARLHLAPGEGALNIAMDRRTILSMAHRYGTLVGRRFVRHWLPRPGQRATAAWDQQRWLRFRLFVPALRDLLGRFGRSAEGSATATPLAELVRAATQHDLLIGTPPGSGRPSPAQAAAWARAGEALAGLEVALRDPDLDAAWPPPRADDPELRLRPPV